MIKRTLALMLALSSVLTIAPIKVKAESLWELYKRDPKAYYEKIFCIDEESKANGCYTDFKGRIEYAKNGDVLFIMDNGEIINRTTNEVIREADKNVIASEGGNNTAGSQTNGKGWVYSSDELHVIGLPEGSNGYTKPGYYGDVDSSYSSGYSGSGKGWVYDADELHVIGLPEGEDGYTMPGYYGDID
ncbi:hypothetical protein SAMN04487770_12820 [Butyrivibrio sp. ob235]|uniref:hypothetical protein n=1 Tax=unclassified Butyrivibrio TaxID=2639466 RepID=UPI0003F73696|nr:MULTISPECIES: hypothetical protein [unclassified Butyrivibrio]SEM18919.1 hypothetical protein SAMN04487770_12820 [Butyrivibrio sp. ob235]